MKNLKVDGIRRLDKEELARSRKIVLDVIGVKRKNIPASSKRANQESVKEKNRVIDIQTLQESKIQKQDINKPGSRNFSRAENKSKESRKKEIYNFDNISKKGKWDKEISSFMDEQEDDMPTDNNSDKQKIYEIKNSLMKLASSLRDNASKIDKNISKKKSKKIEHPKIDKKTESKKLDSQVEFYKKLKTAQKTKKKVDIKSVFNKLIKKLRQAVSTVIGIFKFSKRSWLIMMKLSLLSLLAFVFIYASLIMAVVKFNIASGVGAKILSRIPIPVIISSSRVIDYSYYNKLKKDLAKTNHSREKLDELTKEIIVKQMIEADLKDKYNINEDAGLAEEVLKDVDINVVGISRIKKIKQLIVTEEDFEKIAKKLGDRTGPLTITGANKHLYSEKVTALEVGEVSDIIYQDDGYYIYRCYDKTDSNLVLSYVYVAGISYDRYLEQAVRDYKIWSLVH